MKLPLLSPPLRPAVWLGASPSLQRSLLPSLLPVLLVLLLTTSVAACSSDQLYLAGQNAQLQECRKMPPGDERNRCETRAKAMSHEQYNAEAAKAGGQPKTP